MMARAADVAKVSLSSSNVHASRSQTRRPSVRRDSLAVVRDQPADHGSGTGGGGRHHGSPRHWSKARSVAVGVTVLLIAVTAAVASDMAATSRLLHLGSSHAASAVDGPIRPPVATDISAPGHLVGAAQDSSDPFLTTFGGRYYLFTGQSGGSPPMNIPVESATTFGAWGPITDALADLPAWTSPGYTWAPDLHRFGSTFVLYFTALVRQSDPSMECIGAAVGTAPTGPFQPFGSPTICQTSQGGSIDPRVFTDTDGTNWMIWKSDQNIHGAATPTKIWSAPLTSNGLQFTADPTVIMQPDQPWQGTIVEAPNLVKSSGSYWLIYSGNWFNSSAYAIGAARCAGPQGPCASTSTQPLLGTNAQGEGPGEGSVYRDRTSAWLLYSPWRSRSPHPDLPPRPVAITRLGIKSTGPYLAMWSPPPSPPDPDPVPEPPSAAAQRTISPPTS
jgi:Glycosyl hydrolases family 43